MDEAGNERPGFSLGLHLTGRSRFWFRLFFGSTVAFAALHLVYVFPAIPIPNPFRFLMGATLFAESVFFLGFGGTVAPLIVIGLSLVLVLLWLVGSLAPRARSWCGEHFESRSGARKWAFRPWVLATVWFALFAGHLGLEIDPYLTVVCFTGLLLLLPETWLLLGRVWKPLADRHARRVAVAVAVLWVWAAPDGGVRVGVILWILALLFVKRRLVPWLSLRDRFSFAALSVAGVQLVAALLPMMVDLHGGTPIGDSMVYSFCEADGRVFAAVPRCNPGQFDQCREGVVDEFDGKTMERRARHSFLSPAFTGRLEQLLCMDDRVQVGMDITLVDDVRFEQSMLSFMLADPSEFSTHVLGVGAGDGLDWDPKRRYGFYTGVDTRVVGLDLDTREVAPEIGAVADLGAPAAVKFHRKRDRLYVAMFCCKVVELHPRTFEKTAEYPILNAWELSLDEELDRLLVVGNFGLEVVDLRSGRVIHRARLGLMGRRAAVDRNNATIYVPSTVGGRLQAFDRYTLERLGTVPLGTGIRLPYVSDEFDRVFASSGSTPYSWDARDLARQVR